MKRIAFLISIGLLAVITASPLAAQSVGTGNTKKEKEIADLDTRIKQALAEANDLQRQKERVAEAAGIVVRKPGVPNVRFLPQITVSSPFWRDVEFAKTVGLTTDQQKKMEDVFQQNRLKLIDLNASLAKEDSVLSSLLADLRPEEESRVLGQIDRVAEIRTELERITSRMLLGFRQALTPEQWRKLSTAKPSPEGRK